MTLRDFIKENKEELDEHILSVSPGIRINNDERRLWILNDENLYDWAISERVRI